MTEAFDKLIEAVQDKHKALQNDIVMSRKKGMDTTVSEWHAHTIPAKIMVAQATQKNEDVQNALQLIALAQQELQDLRPNDFLARVNVELKEMQLYKEMEKTPAQKVNDEKPAAEAPKQAGATGSTSAVSQVNEAIKIANQHLKEKNAALCQQDYQKIMSLYREIPQPLKKQLYQICVMLHGKIQALSAA